MHISNFGVQTLGEFVEFQAEIRSTVLREPFLLRYRFPSAISPYFSTNLGNPLVAALLIGAMRTGEPLEVPAPISPKFAQALKRIQTIYYAWDRTLSKVEVHASLGEEMPETRAEVGLFFSCGVDSFYSLIKNTTDDPLNEAIITQLIVVHGIDILLNSEWKRTVYTTMLANSYTTAQQFGKQVLPVSTNVKDLISGIGVPWGRLAHGSALASIGLLLEKLFKKVYIASDMSYASIWPNGSHLLLDPLWSTESCTFVHDGCEATRLEKIKFIAESQIAMDTLRVCWARESPEYNCGQCAKCLRAMMALHIIGASDRCRTLPSTIDLNLLRKIPLLHSYEFAVCQEYLTTLGNSETDTKIHRSLVEGLTARKPYFDRLERAEKTINKLVPVQDEFILVDEDTIREELGAGRKVIPFLEREGIYYGNPPDDATAIHELERLRSKGAKYIVFWWADFWWLDYYAGLSRHLRSKYSCILEDNNLIIFSLI